MKEPIFFNSISLIIIIISSAIVRSTDNYTSVFNLIKYFEISIKQTISEVWPVSYDMQLGKTLNKRNIVKTKIMFNVSL